MLAALVVSVLIADISPVWFGGLGSGLVLLATPALIRVTKNWRETRIQARIEKQKEKALETRVATLETDYTELAKAVGEVLTFIKGSEDPFTHVVSGGLLATLAKLEGRLKNDN